MAQNEDQKPDTRKSDTAAQEAASVNQEEGIDAASINALAGENASGEFVRNNAKKVSKKQSPPPNEDTTQDEKEEEFEIPVLRTYEHDTRQLAQTKGGAELRTALAKEAEEKRKAQEEYIRKTKDVTKESAVLRDRVKNFKKRQKGGEITPSAAETATAQQQINKTLSGATAYMRSVQEGVPKKTPAPTPPDEPTKKEPVPEPTKSTNTAVNNNKPSDEVKKEGIFSKARGRKRSLTQEEKQMLKKKQEKIVEKESIKNALQDLKQDKKRLREMGLAAQDVRSYTAEEEQKASPNSTKKQLILTGIISILLVASVASVIFLAFKPVEEPITPDEPNTQSVSDVMHTEEITPVNVSDALTAWKTITTYDNGTPNTVTKFVPYTSINGKEKQISFADFLKTFSVNAPSGLRNALGNYYFVGKYLTENAVHGVFIVEVEKYGDAFVWMRRWKQGAGNAFVSVFPGFFRQSNSRNITIKSDIIDNQDVHIIQNTFSEKDLTYYFFGRSLLVFIAGDTTVIPLINARIRAANTR